MSDFTTRPAPLPSSPPLEDSAKPTVYRPLSLIAVTGFGLAALYSAFIIIGGLVALFRGTPWLISPVWVFVPIIAALLSGGGLLAIKRSEGTLAGEKVARWGLALSILVGVSYFAYYGATYVAIGREAQDFSRDFLQKLTRREDLAAFRLTLNPAARPAEGPGLRGEIERRFNGLNDMGQAGLLTRFVQDKKVRMIAVGGPDKTTMEPLGISRLEYASGNYEVDLQYRVTTPQIDMVLHLPVVGKAGKGSEGRQWAVVWSQVAMTEGSSQMTELGHKMFPSAMHSREYLETKWFPLVREGRKAELYFQTLRLEERKPLEPAAAVMPIGLLAGSMASGCPALTRIACLPGYDLLLDTTFVRADKNDFWAPDDIRDDLIRMVREEFRRPRTEVAEALQFPKSSELPRILQTGDRVAVEVDMTMMLPLGPTPRYQLDCRLLLDYDAAEIGKPIITSWRLRHLDLVSGRSMPANMPMRPDMMRPDMMRPPGGS